MQEGTTTSVVVAWNVNFKTVSPRPGTIYLTKAWHNISLHLSLMNLRYNNQEKVLVCLFYADGVMSIDETRLNVVLKL